MLLAILYCSLSHARVAVELLVITGNIHTLSGGEITLTDGKKFEPAANAEPISQFRPGDTISLRYFKTADGRNVYVNVAYGAKKWQETTPVQKNKTDAL